MENESSWAKCPGCGRTFRHLADEYPDQCPYCGWEPKLPEEE